MLILTRRVGESVIVGENVAVTILSIKGQQVRVGVNAPKSVPVHRKEVYERMRANTSGDVQSLASAPRTVKPPKKT